MFTMFLFKFISFFAFCCCFTEAARILTVVPMPSISHQMVFRPLTQELAKRGHHVTVITTDPAFPKGNTPDNLTEIDIHDFSYKAWREAIFSERFRSDATNRHEQIKIMLKLISEIFEMQMSREEVKAVINNTNHFDLLIIESCVPTAFALSHVFKVPVISMSSMGGFLDWYDIIGAPSRPPLLYPTILRSKLVNLSLWDKITELYKHYRVEMFLNTYIEENNKVIKRIFGPDTPPLAELNKNVDMLFLNVHPIWEFNRPMPPNAIYMGGLHQNPSKELPKDLKAFLDSSKNGVIYISYGTNVSPSLLPPEKVRALVQAFSELPYDVLWKWDTDELPDRSQNIRISKWLPQSDLLRHPKIKLFITQGGLQSTDEAITAGVPLIGMPVLGDQRFNVEMYVHHKIGLRLDMGDVTKETFKHAINTVMNDNSYRINIERLRSIISDQPQKPLERAVWWTEHLLRHGGASHLKSVTAGMTWKEYLDLQLLAFVTLSALTILIAILLVTYFLFNIVKRNLFTSNKLKKN